MGLIEKLENMINKLLTSIGDTLWRAFMKLIPTKIQKMFVGIVQMFGQIKNLPTLIKSLPSRLKALKASAQLIDVKGKLKEGHAAAMAQGQESAKEFKNSMAPLKRLKLWFESLEFTHQMILVCFTAASVVAGGGIIFTSNKLIALHTDANRTPASVEMKSEEVVYERPEYYKEQRKQLNITSLRLPVFYANVNELKSIDVDFTAIMDTRMARMELEKIEFNLRDHLIQEVEPMIAAFPLEEEGKDILRHKLKNEINIFLTNQKIEGEVKEINLTYILAN